MLAIVRWMALALAFTPGAGAVDAFPGALGYGKGSRGGRGGAVFHVTNLNDGGAGSLRACVDASGPRTCIFRVGGTINLGRRLEVLNPYLTIAGQTAPGGGIQLRGSDSLLYLYRTHDIVLRHLRVRPNKGPSGSHDAVVIDGSREVILQHMSLAYASDENLSCTGSNVVNITVQATILALGLQPHSKGFLGCNNTYANLRDITVHGSLFAHNNDRNPNIELSAGGQFEFVNNVVYNWRSEAVEVHDTAEGGPIAEIENNYFKRGPSTVGSTCAVNYLDEDGDPAEGTVWASGNRLEGFTCLLSAPANARTVAARSRRSTVSAPESALEALARVDATAGAWPRDALDLAIVGDLRQGTGSIIAVPTMWPTLAGGTPYPDDDADGMDDDWEAAHGLDPGDPADRNRVVAAAGPCRGYTALECWLHQRHEDIVP